MQTGLNLHAVLKRVQIAISFSSMLYIATCVKYGAGNDFIYFPRAIAMISCLGIGITFYLTEQKRITKFLYQSVFLGSVLLSLSRTAIFVVGVTFFSLTVWRSKKQLLATLMSLTTLFTFAYFIFLLPVIRNRFNFIGDQATFGGRTINTAGRTKIWGVILQESSDSIFLGHGIGSSEDLVLSNFQTISQPHNDFLRIFFDFGILGFIVLCLMLLLLGLDGKTRRNSTSANALMFKIKNVLALQLFSFMLTDNPIVYPFYTLPLFFILGVSSGQSNSQRSLE
jgi:O-antigen ligase